MYGYSYIRHIFWRFVRKVTFESVNARLGKCWRSTADVGPTCHNWRGAPRTNKNWVSDESCYGCFFASYLAACHGMGRPSMNAIGPALSDGIAIHSMRLGRLRP